MAPPVTFIIEAAQKRTPFTDEDWLVVRGVDKTVPRILFNYPIARHQVTERWMSLGDTVVVGSRTLRFENLEFGNTAGDWTVTMLEVLPDTPAYRPPAVNPTWQPAELRPFGSLGESALAALEQRIGSTLPPNYRRWLAENNGAAPVEDVSIKGWDFCLNDIHPLLGVHPDVPYRDLSFGERHRTPWLTDEFLVIAVPLGGILAVKLRDVYRDQIVFVSDAAMQAAHHYDPAVYSSPADFLARVALFVVAGNMTEFCINLQPLPPVTPGELSGPGPGFPGEAGPVFPGGPVQPSPW